MTGCTWTTWSRNPSEFGRALNACCDAPGLNTIVTAYGPRFRPSTRIEYGVGNSSPGGTGGPQLGTIATAGGGAAASSLASGAGPGAGANATSARKTSPSPLAR